MVTTFYPPYHFGGDALFVRSLARKLVDEGHHVEVVHCEDAYRLRGDSMPQASDSDGHDAIVVHRLRSRFRALSPLVTQQTGRPGFKHRALARILGQPFDVIHFHNISLVGGPAVLAMGKAQVKLYTAHENWLICPTHVLWKNRWRACDRPQCLRCCLRSGIPPQLWRYTGLVARSLRHVDMLFAPSEFVARKHRERGIACPITVLPNFTPMQVPVEPPPPPPHRPHFLYAGRLTPSKGVIDLVDLFRQLPQYDLSIAGDGELRDALRRRAAGHGHIRLLGEVPWEELPSLYRQATATIVPSLGPEVFSLVILESMACGTPVIVREAGGAAESVNKTGGGVVYRDSAELCRAMERMSGDHDWRAALARSAERGQAEHYAAPAHLRRYFEIINEVADRKRSGASAVVPSIG